MARLACILSILTLVLALLAALHHVECRYNLQDHGAVLASGSSGRTEEQLPQQGMNHPPSRTFDDPAEGANYFLPPPRLPPAHVDAAQATPSHSDAMADSRFLQETSQEQEQEQEQEEDQDPTSTASESKPSSKVGYHAHSIGINRRPPPPGSNSPHT